MAVIIPIIQYAMIAYEAYSLYETLTAKPQLPANQISDLSVQTSDWGTGIPQIYGVQRIAGNIIWSTDKKLVGGTQGKFGGKGGGGGKSGGGGGKGKKGTGNQGYYTAAVAFALCEGPVAGIKKIWAGGVLIFDDSAPVYVPSMNQNQPQGTYVQFETQNQPLLSTGGSSLGSWTLYHGTGAQTADPTIVSNGSGLGTNGVPYQTVNNQNGNTYTYGSPQFGKQGTACAYRGVAYIVFDALNLGFGGTMPQLTFEVVGAQPTLVLNQLVLTQPVKTISNINSTFAAELVDGQYLYASLDLQPLHQMSINVLTGNVVNIQNDPSGGNWSPVGAALLQQASSTIYSGGPVYHEGSIPNGLFTGISIYGSGISGSPAFIAAMASFELNDLPYFVGVVGSSYFIVQPFLTTTQWPQQGGLNTVEPFIFTPSATPYSQSIAYTNNKLPVINGVAYLIATTSTAGIYDLVGFDGQQFTQVGGIALPAQPTSIFGDGTDVYAACGVNQATEIYKITTTGVVSLWLTIHLTVSGGASYNFQFAQGYLFAIQRGGTAFYKFNADGSIRYSVNSGFTDLEFAFPYGSGFVLGGTTSSGFGYALSNYGDTEIVPQQVDLSSAVSDICSRAGLTNYDVSLLPATAVQLTRKAGIAARDILKALCQVYLVDMVDSAGTLRFVPKGQNISAQIGIEEVGFSVLSEAQVPAAPYSLTRSQGYDLPRSVTIEYTSALIQFNRYAQQFQIMFPEGKDIKTSVPLTLGDMQALNVAMFLCASPHIEKSAYAWTLSFKWLALEPGDVVQMPWGVTRITQVTIKDGQKSPTIEYQGVIDASYVLAAGYGNAQAVAPQVLGQIDAPVAPLAAAGTGNYVANNVQGGGSAAFVPTQPPLIVGTAYSEFLEVPPLTSTQTSPFYLVAPYSSGNSFVGAQIWESTDSGVTYTELAEQSSGGITGFVETALPDTQPYTWDNQSVVNVYLNAPYMLLSSATDIQVIQGANLALIGSELIQFANANLMTDANGAAYYQISRLLRGRRGTEWALSTHAVQETFTLIQPNDETVINYSLPNINNGAQFKVVTAGQDISKVNPTQFAPVGLWYKPFSPANAVASRDGSGNWNVSFTPRARLNGWWASGVAPALDADTQTWSIDILNGATIVRTVSGSLSSPSFQYTGAMQAADGFVAGQNGITFNIYEVGQLGRGNIGAITTNATTLNSLLQVSFGIVSTQSFINVNPVALIDFSNALTSISTFTRFTEGTEGTVTVTGGTCSVVHSGTENDILAETSSTYSMPQAFVEINVASITGSPTSYNNGGVGICKDNNNFLWASIDVLNNAARIQIKVAGTSTILASVAYSFPASFKLGMSLIGNSACLWINAGAGWTYITGASVSAYYNFITSGNLTGWTAGFAVANGGGSTTWDITEFKSGRYGTVHMRDMTIVTNKNGTPYLNNNTVYFTATCSDPLGTSYCGCFNMNLGTLAIAQQSAIMVNRNGGIYNDASCHILWSAGGVRQVVIATWGNGSNGALHNLYAEYTAQDPMIGTQVLSNMTQLLLPQASGVNPGDYDAMLVYDASASLWVIGYVQVSNTSFSGNPFWAACATSPDLNTWTLVGADTTHNGYEGAKLTYAFGTYWLAVGGPAGSGNSSRVYSPFTMQYLGSLDAIFNGGTLTQPHPMTFQVGSIMYLMTFDDTKYGTNSFTWGNTIIEQGAA